MPIQGRVGSAQGRAPLDANTSAANPSQHGRSQQLDAGHPSTRYAQPAQFFKLLSQPVAKRAFGPELVEQGLALLYGFARDLALEK
jgi:hypothetical protein